MALRLCQGARVLSSFIRAPATHQFRPRYLAATKPLVQARLLSSGDYSHDGSQSDSFTKTSKWGAALALAAGSAFALNGGIVDADEGNEKAPELPVYRMEEVKKHTTRENGMWVIVDGNIYDITTFADGHPGGKDKIALAAGGDVADYWAMYPIHHESEAVKEVLAERLIGTLDPQDREEVKEVPNDRFKDDPKRSKVFNVLVERPFNAEVPASLLVHNYITPNSLWFCRHHHPVPTIDPTNFFVDVEVDRNLEGGDGKRISLNLDALRKRKAEKIVATIQCTGNRRAELTALERTMGQPWSVGGISTAEFEGVPVRDLLAELGITSENLQGAEHVQFFAGDEPFASSVPISKVLSPTGGVVLAYKMNGTDLPRDHGFPLRVIVPGCAGVRSVKWVNRIVISGEEAPGTWNRGMSYKFFPHWVKNLDGVDMSKQTSVYDLPVNSCICGVNDGSPVVKSDDTAEIKGFAYSGGGRGIVSVQVTADGGETWHPAELEEGKDQPYGQAWAWTFWTASISIPAGAKEKGEVNFAVRAFDNSFNSQPERTDLCWNVRGLLNNSWHRLSVPIQEDEE